MPENVLALFRAKGPATYQPMATPWETIPPMALMAEPERSADSQP